MKIPSGWMQKALLCAVVIILSSCAGLRYYSDAREQFERGLALFNQGRYEEAVPYFQKATELKTDYANAYFYLGRSYLNLGRWTAALPPLRTAFRLSPETMRSEVVTILFDALFGAASHEFRKGNYRDSIGFLKEALELEPQSVQARDELVSVLIALGGSLLAEGKTDEAITTYNEVLGLSSRNGHAYVGLARAFLKNGDFIKALQAVRNALSVDPSDREIQNLFNEMISR